MSIADPARELTEIGDFGELLRFEYQLVVSQAVEFRELWVHRDVVTTLHWQTSS